MENSDNDKHVDRQGSEMEDPEHGNKPYDLHELHQMANNDENFITHALQIFIENSEEGLLKLKQAISTENWKLVRETVHKLLPSYTHLKVNTVIPLLYQVKNSEPAGSGLPEKKALVIEIIAEIERVLSLMKRETGNN
jgi:hypothetical protein